MTPKVMPKKKIKISHFNNYESQNPKRSPISINSSTNAAINWNNLPILIKYISLEG